jgi:hypothetical protein
MSNIDQSTAASGPTVERKRWETPAVVIGTTRGDTYSNINTLGVDGHSVGGSSYGS